MKKRFVVLIAALSALAFASPATGAVTVGQLAPLGVDHTDCGTDRDRLIPVTTSGNSYAVPGTGALTFWSTNADPDASGMLGLKVFRRISQDLFMIVGHDGPRPLFPTSTNTFPVNIPVARGDIVGVITGPGGPSCEFEGGNDEWADVTGPYADGQTGLFSNSGGGLFYAINISAVFEPTNSFTVGQVTRNKKKGTATVALTVPNAGELTGSGKGVKVASAGAQSAKAVTPGTATLTIKAKGKNKRTLNRTGRVKVKPKITYTPTGGAPSSQQLKVRLRKR